MQTTMKILSNHVYHIRQNTLRNGGLSVNPFYGSHEPKTGYMVALQGHELVIPVELFNYGSIVDYLEKKSNLLMGDASLFLGTWLNDGKVYLDISENVLNFDDAIIKGLNRQQLAIFNLNNMSEVSL